MTAQQFKDKILGCYDSMLAVACRILGTEDEAQDAVQDVCRRLWERYSEIAPPANPGAFCAVTVRNYCLDIIRSRPLDAGDEPLATIAESKAVDETDAKDDATSLLQKAIDRLEQRSRQIIQWGLQGYSYSQMAAELHTSEANVRQVTSRARRQLRNIIVQMQSL